MSDETMFRFLNVRPGRHTGRRAPDPTRQPLYAPGQSTPFSKSISDLEAAGSNPAVIERTVNAFRESAGYVRGFEGLEFDIGKGVGWLSEHGRRKLNGLNVGQSLKAVYGEELTAVTAKPNFGKTWLRMADSLLAEGLSPHAPTPDREALVAAHKLMSIMIRLAGGATQPSAGTLGQWLHAITLLLPRPVKGRAPTPAPQPTPTLPPTPPPEDPRGKADLRLTALEDAHRELSRLAIDEKALIQQEPPRPIPGNAGGGGPNLGGIGGTGGSASGGGGAVGGPLLGGIAGLAEVQTRLKSLEGTLANRLAEFSGSMVVEKVRLGSTLAEFPTSPMRFDPRALEGLSEGTRRTLGELKVNLASAHPTALVGRIEEEMGGTMALAGALPTNVHIWIGGVMLNKERLHSTLMGPGLFPLPAPIMAHICDFKAGVGDLLMVRQKLKAYELGEFAHVENVLAGESRVREHRRINLREEIQAEEEERETEKERDLQSTDRNEVQNEAEKTVKSQFSLEAGLQVSGSYGPSVSFSANLGTSFSTSTEETQRKSVSYSREVTEKTSEKVRERIKKEVRRRTLEQNEELNRHAVENAQSGAKHVRGIYRWLNKVYDAQIVNYGQRMMYEFVVPEPAHFFLHAVIENPPKENEIIKPEPPRYLGQALKPIHITRTNYVKWVAQYQVRNVAAPPPEFQHVAYFDKQDHTQDGSTFGRSGKIDVPAGYEAYAATVMSDYAFTEGETHCYRVMIGNTFFDRTTAVGCTHRNLDRRYKEMAVSYFLFRAWAFTLGIDVHCRLTAEGLAKWQQAVFDSIMEAYLQQKAEFDEHQAATAIQKGIPILGRNPLENRRLERDELKKLIIMILTDTVDVAKDSMQGLPAGAAPLMDLDRICENGSFIRFFENAFEWNNILYVFYPYFWGRTARWISAIHFTDPDPDFAAFLKAGAARVQVPVRPGFEKAVAYFCQFGRIWEGGDPPLRDDDLYVPIVDEIAENLGKLDDGVPYPEGSGPWEVRVPTSLVVVQNLEEIPGIVDSLTGNPIALE